MGLLLSLVQAECEKCGAPTSATYRYYTPLRPDGEPVPPARMHEHVPNALVIPCRRPGCDGVAVRGVGRGDARRDDWLAARGPSGR